MTETTYEGKGRITTRVPQSVLDLIQEAANLTGATVNQFIVQSALQRAEGIIDREKVISLSKDETTMFLEMLDNPKKPNKALSEAFERFNVKVKNGDIHTTTGSSS